MFNDSAIMEVIINTINQCCWRIPPVGPSRGHAGSGTVNKVLPKAVLTQNVCSVLSGELYIRFSEVL